MNTLDNFAPLYRGGRNSDLKVRLRPDHRVMLDREARKRGLTISDLTRLALAKLLDPKEAA